MTNVWCVGAGAVGGCVASRLVRNGIDVYVVDTNDEHARLLRDPGLIVGGLDGGVTTPVPAGTLDDAPFSPDVVLLAVRSLATKAAVSELVSHLRDNTDVVSLQNGINEDAIAAIVGEQRTIGCVVGFGATWISSGHITLDADGELTIGRLDGSVDARLHEVADLLGRSFITRVTDNVRGALWGKMLVNSMTVLGALTGMLTGELLADGQRRRIVACVMTEGVRVAIAEGVDVPPVLGRVQLELLDTADWANAMDQALQRFGERFGAIRSVTLRDIEIGRPTEIDAVTGAIVTRGRAAGVATPLNAAVYGMLREIEAGDRGPSAANLGALCPVGSQTQGVG